jgi:membrane protein YdbS with pleckstrin-like domain
MKKILGWFLVLLPFIAAAVAYAIKGKLLVFFVALGIAIICIALVYLGISLMEN